MDARGLPPDAEAQVTELVSRLRAAGWEPSAEEVAEALWLARRIGVRPPETAEASVPRQAPASGESAGRPPRSTGPAGTDPAPRERDVPEKRSPPVSLYAPVRHGGAPGGAFPVRAPAASTLPGLLGFQRALRPLAGYRPRLPSVPRVLDEAQTAELSASSGAVRAVLTPARRPETELLLLMDASATSSVWQLTFEKLRQTCERLGAFRDVQALHLHRGSDGAPLIGTGPDRAATRLRPADQYRDTSGRRLTLVVSDCVGPLWQDGGAQRMLHRWAAASPVAVVQPLPPRLWPRTALPGE
ncbi:SAV_2336 N-terminal domain-related protein, partial [Streptomyces nanshensis]